MSGPTTAIIGVDPVAILLSAAVINAVQSVVQAHQDAAVLHSTQQDERDLILSSQRQALGAGKLAMQESLQIAEQEFSHLLALAETIGYVSQVTATRPAAPDSNDLKACMIYAQTVHSLVEQLRPVLLAESARRAHALADGQELDLQQASAAVVPQALVPRLMARIAHIQDIPEKITALARELESSLPGARASSLATELRIQIQSLLETHLQQQVQTANALILEQSLKDLGYQVEEIEHTLFVDGGIVHFRRQSWGNYMVRMRIDPQTKSANFNVIRAVKEGENERSVLDHLAEDRWCAEFPSLLKSLEARGMTMQVTRRLEAGELPVQLVDANQLPQFKEEEQYQKNSVNKTFKLSGK